MDLQQFETQAKEMIRSKVGDEILRCKYNAALGRVEIVFTSPRHTKQHQQFLALSILELAQSLGITKDIYIRGHIHNATVLYAHVEMSSIDKIDVYKPLSELDPKAYISNSALR